MWFQRLFYMFSLFGLHTTGAAKVLCMFYFPSISHQIVYQPIWQELSLRGHQVTVVATDPLKNPKLTNLTEFDMHFAYDILKKHPLDVGMSKDKFLVQSLLYMFELMEDLISSQLENEKVQQMLKNPETEFNVVLVEHLNPIVLGLSHRFKAPIISFSSFDTFLNNYDAVGNPTHPITSPDLFMGMSGKLSLYEKVQSTFFNIWYRIMYYYFFLPKSDTVARTYFGEDMPYLGDLEKNISLLMLNVNPLFYPIRPNVPTIIELGQMHIKPEKPLPKDLQSFLDASPEGVIYFSLGSNVKSANLNTNLLNIIISALSELSYKVLWKWETDFLPNQPKNVVTRKWLPQQDILRHHNIKAFVTQCGLQSMEEAVLNGVPLIGIPFFGDQLLNQKKMIQMGIAKGLDYETMTKDQLRDTIIEVATSEKYRSNAKRIGELLKDQPMTGLEKAIWWIEYVIRHNGTSHLRSSAIYMPLYEYLLIDVFFLIISISILTICIFYLIIKFVLILVQRKQKLKTT